jgi:hypothetical protein
MSSQSTLKVGDVVSITEAAHHLGVSVRTVQRRLDGGQLEAVWEGDTRRVRLPIEGDRATRQGDTSEGDTRRDSGTTRHDAPQGDIQRDTSRDNTTNAQSTLASLIAEKDARITDLRATVEAQRLQIEAANRTAAEAQAALREALKMSNRALMEPGQSTLEVVSSAPAESRPAATDEAQSTLMSKEAGQPTSGPQIEAEHERGGRKTFRKWLLEILRG